MFKTVVHHFQLKPVRSLDSLRPAWSGHLRHGPPPSTVTNPIETTSAKSLSNVPSSTFINPVARSNVLLDTDGTPVANPQVGVSKTAALDSLASQSQAADKASSLFVSQRNTGDTQPSELKVHTNELITYNYNASLHSQKVDSKQSKSYSERCSKNIRFYTDDILTNCDPETGDSSFDTPLKHLDANARVKENDPFDTSKVFTPSYLQSSVFQSTNASVSVNSHVPSHAFSSTSCSAHSKVNATVHYLFCSQFYVRFSMIIV